MTAYVVAFFLQWHIAALPIFAPKPSGIHNGFITVSAAPRWKHILHTQEFQRPTGVIFMMRTKW
jgi:hypothetical protein